jgi:lipoprotein signal peptidase
MDTLFSPLSGDQCTFFYAIMIFTYVLAVLVIVSGVAFGISRGKNGMFYVSVVSASIYWFVLYYISRLLYSMCSKSM